MNRPTEVWVVEGSSGEYSDHIEWPVCYYCDEALAREHVELASARFREIKQILIDDDCDVCYGAPEDYCEKHKGLKNAWDESMRCDYTGTNYAAYRVTLGPLTAVEVKEKP